MATSRKTQTKANARQSDVPFTRSGDVGEGSDLTEGRDLTGDGRDLGDGRPLGGGRSLGINSPVAIALKVPAGIAAGSRWPAASTASGEDILKIAVTRLGQKYVLGARAPMGNAEWQGPWDCAEYVSWSVYQASGILFGTEPRHDPVLADAYTGYWARQAQSGGHTISIEEAARIPGAVILRIPRTGATGHIVLSDGKGGTFEAHSSKLGVIQSTLSGRRWDFGILVPGIQYLREDQPASIKPPTGDVLRLTQPLTHGARVLAVQQALMRNGETPGALDSVYGPQTAHAVARFQARKGLLVDGEVGPSTRKALG